LHDISWRRGLAGGAADEEDRPMKTEIQNPYPETEAECFFCGPLSHDGLKLRFFWDDERREVSTEYVPERRFAGQGDILHGAIQMGLLDEIMGWTTVVESGQMAVTIDIAVKFLRPVYIADAPVSVACRVAAREDRNVDLEAELTSDDGVVCTTATARYRLLSAERFERLVYRP
jgi:acyl-coenzyme A thioesterase PaaI-like protein